MIHEEFFSAIATVFPLVSGVFVCTDGLGGFDLIASTVDPGEWALARLLDRRGPSNEHEGGEFDRYPVTVSQNDGSLYKSGSPQQYITIWQTITKHRVHGVIALATPEVLASETIVLINLWLRQWERISELEYQLDESVMGRRLTNKRFRDALRQNALARQQLGVQLRGPIQTQLLLIWLKLANSTVPEYQGLAAELDKIQTSWLQPLSQRLSPRGLELGLASAFREIPQPGIALAIGPRLRAQDLPLDNPIPIWIRMVLCDLWVDVIKVSPNITGSFYVEIHRQDWIHILFKGTDLAIPNSTRQMVSQGLNGRLRVSNTHPGEVRLSLCIPWQDPMGDDFR